MRNEKVSRFAKWMITGGAHSSQNKAAGNADGFGASLNLAVEAAARPLPMFALIKRR
jgi:hypothetical protein